MSADRIEQEAFYRALESRKREMRLTWTEICNQAQVSRRVPWLLGRGLGVSGRAILRLSAWLRHTDPARVQHLEHLSRIPHNIGQG